MRRVPRAQPEPIARNRALHPVCRHDTPGGAVSLRPSLEYMASAHHNSGRLAFSNPQMSLESGSDSNAG